MIDIRRRTVTFGLAAAAMMPPRFAWAESAKLTFVLTNDIYQMGETAMPDGKTRGGFARLAAVVKAERDRARTSGGPVLFAHGGDTLSPSLMSGIDQGSHIVELTNLIKPDIFVPGNHEFDFGKATFLKRSAEMKFPLFAANMTNADGKLVPGYKDRDIITLGNLRIGLTGAAHDGTPRMSNSGDLAFAPTVAAMRAQCEALQRDGADLVVVVMHADRAQTLEFARTNLADVILTGHTHDLFIDFDGRTLAVESSYDAHYVTVIDLNLEVTQRGNRREIAWWPQFRVIDTATVTPDPEVAAAVAGFERLLNGEMDVPLGTTAVELDSRVATVRGHEAAIGNLIADAMRVRGHADAAIMNGGGIRAAKVYPAGSAVTRRDVLGELPFGNHLVVVAVKGSDLRAAIENGLSRLPAIAGRFPQVSGMRVEYDVQRPPGSRVVSMEVGGAPLDPDRMYKVATNDFLARGSDGYTALTHNTPAVPPDDSPRLSNEVMVYLREQGVRTGIDGRMRAK
ncbi:MAG: bifunctional metallophosphatase/5'-nucleotidase [Xanthobacteraceae bacterium]|nr:bifunctional metallophosphatase/5'-nucleotidase [Xanthobacteraceae bacterium]